MQIKIEKHIPMPSRGIGGTDAMRAMEVGDSILLEKLCRSNLYRLKGYRFSTRKVAGGYRVWRVA